MIELTALEPGTVVEIFEDPMTEKIREGRAELVEDLGIMVPCADNQELHHWVVKFIGDSPEEPVERWVKVRKRTIG